MLLKTSILSLTKKKTLWEKEKMLGTRVPAFSPFTQNFQEPSFIGSVQVGIVRLRGSAFHVKKYIDNEMSEDQQ